MSKRCPLCDTKLKYTQKKYCSNYCRNEGTRLRHAANRLLPKELKYKEIIQKEPLTPEQIQKIKENRKIKLVARSIKWQKENPVKVYASQVALQNKELVAIIYECPCEHPKKHNHHFDYSRPLEVIRLCPACHSAEHKRLRSLSANAVAI